MHPLAFVLWIVRSLFALLASGNGLTPAAALEQAPCLQNEMQAAEERAHVDVVDLEDVVLLSVRVNTPQIGTAPNPLQQENNQLVVLLLGVQAQ